MSNTGDLNGYTCPNCGQWVYFNQVHYCPPEFGIGNVEFSKCEHCYCIPVLHSLNGTSPHRQCCKCGDIMAEEFISLPKLGFKVEHNPTYYKLELGNSYKRLTYHCAKMYFPNCRTCDCGFYTNLEHFKSLKDLLEYASDNWADYELEEIYNSYGKCVGCINYKTGYHSVEYLEVKFKYLTLRTKGDGKGNLIWYRI